MRVEWFLMVVSQICITATHQHTVGARLYGTTIAAMPTSTTRLRQSPSLWIMTTHQWWWEGELTVPLWSLSRPLKRRSLASKATMCQALCTTSSKFLSGRKRILRDSPIYTRRAGNLSHLQIFITLRILTSYLILTNIESMRPKEKLMSMKFLSKQCRKTHLQELTLQSSMF